MRIRSFLALAAISLGLTQQESHADKPAEDYALRTHDGLSRRQRNKKARAKRMKAAGRKAFEGK